MIASRLFSGTTEITAIDISERAFNYGDGVFETLRVHQGEPVLWAAHWQRLQRGAHALGIALPDEAFVFAQGKSLCGNSRDAVLKIVLAAGGVARGYARNDEAMPTLALSLHAMPAILPPQLRLRWCDLRLSSQPALAGIKHLNRLENVLARREWRDESIHEGLMCDQHGHVVCATAANLFAKIDGQWRTPFVRQCGIAGVMRQWLLAHVEGAVEAELAVGQVKSAQALFLCNSVRGIMEVGRLDEVRFAHDAGILLLQQQLASAHPAFMAKD